MEGRKDGETKMREGGKEQLSNGAKEIQMYPSRRFEV